MKWLIKMTIEAKYIIVSFEIREKEVKVHFKYNLIMNITEECNIAQS